MQSQIMLDLHRQSCPGWRIVNASTEPEIQRCDACRTLTDTQAAQIPKARDALRAALVRLADNRREAERNRRTAIVTAVGALVSPCCDVPVTVWGVYKTTDLTHGMRGKPDHHSVSCGACNRTLNVPPEVDLNVEFAYP